MRMKGRIRSSGVFLVGTPEDTDRSLRKAVIEQQWHNYQITNDLECLAQICEHADYFGNSEISQVLAREFRGRSRRVKGYETELDWERAFRLYDQLSNDPAWRGSKMAEARRLRIAELLEVREADRDKWAERFRKRMKARRQAD